MVKWCQAFMARPPRFISCKTNLNHLNHNLNIANWPGGRSIGPWWGVSSPSSRDLLSFPTRTTTCNSTATWSLVRFSQLTYLWMSEASGLENLTICPCKLVIIRMIQVKRTNQKNKKSRRGIKKSFHDFCHKRAGKKNTLYVPIHNVTIQFDVFGWGGAVYT